MRVCGAGHELLQQAWWISVFCRCKTMHASMVACLPVARVGAHQSVGLTFNERVLGRAVGSAAIAASCLQRYVLDNQIRDI